MVILGLRMILGLKGTQGIQEAEPDWEKTPYVIVSGEANNNKQGEMSRWRSNPEVMFEEKTALTPEGHRSTRSKRQTDHPVPDEVSFKIRNIEDLGKVLEVARRPLKTSVYGITHKLDLSAFAERELELERSAQAFLEAPRMTTASVTNSFSPTSRHSEELRFWPRMKYETCLATCASHDAQMLSDHKVWEEAISVNPSLSVWIAVQQVQEELIVDEKTLPRLPVTVATWGGKPIEERCQVANSYVSALAAVGLILPSHSNRTSLVETLGSGIGIFNSRGGGSITDLMWSTDPGARLAPDYYSRFPNQHEGEKLEKNPESPRMALIVRPTKFLVWANSTNCYATLSQVADWTLRDQQCACQRSLRDISRRDRENLAMRRDQNRLAQDSLRSWVRPMNKRTDSANRTRNSREVREEDYRGLMEFSAIDEEFDQRMWKYLKLKQEELRGNGTREKRSLGILSAVWSLGTDLLSILDTFKDEKIKDMRPQSILEGAVHYVTSHMFGTKPIKKKRIAPEVLLTPSKLPRVADRLDVDIEHGSLLAYPKESIRKQRANVLTDPLAEQTLQATGPAVIELDEAKALRNEFYRFGMVPALQPHVLRTMKLRKEVIADVTAVIYDLAPGTYGMYLIYTTKRRDYKQEMEHHYIPLPEWIDPETHLYHYPEMTHQCKEVFLEKRDLMKTDYEDGCPPRRIPVLSRTEHTFPEDLFTIQTFVNPGGTTLEVACPGTGRVREVCRGTCALRLGNECTLHYEGEKSSDGVVPPKKDQTYEDSKMKELARTYEVLSNEKIREATRKHPWESADPFFLYSFAVVTAVVFIVLAVAAVAWWTIPGIRFKRRMRPNDGSVLGFGDGKYQRATPPRDEEDPEEEEERRPIYIRGSDQSGQTGEMASMHWVELKCQSETR